MKRWTIAALVATLVIVVATVLFVMSVQSPTFTSQVKCTDYETTIVEGSTFSNGSQSFDTVSAVTTFTSTANYSTTIGHTSVNTRGPLAESGTGETYITQSCTFG